MRTHSMAQHPPTRLFAGLQLALSTLVFAVPLSAADWPQWRGPERDGVARETGLASSWPEGGPPVVLRITAIGEGYGAVAIAGDELFVQGTRGDRSVVFAFDRTTGEALWSRELGARLIQDKGNGPRSTPTVVGDTLVVLNGRGELASLKRATGEVNWQLNIVERFGGRVIRWGISESPLVEDGTIYVMPGGSRATIAALELVTGDTAWTSRGLRDAASYSSLISADVGGIEALIGFTQQAGIGVRKSNGELLWRYEAPANRTANAATPVFGDDTVFYTSSYGVGGGAIRLRRDGDGIAHEELYFASNLQNHHGGVVLYEGHLYGFFGPALGCVELATGEVKWRARSVGKGSLTIADGKLYLLGERRQVGLAEATPEGYREGGRFEIENRGWPSWAYPVVDRGRLYIRNQEVLTVYDVAR